MLRAFPVFVLMLAGCPQLGPGRALQPEGCDEGFLDDGGACIPVGCGTGTWGELPVDDATVFVDIAAAEGGDGSVDAPLRSIQVALDLAGARGGGLVATAAGSYAETLALDSAHAGVRLAGRCRELVTLDASAGALDTPGIDIRAGYGAVELSGLSVVGATGQGVMMGSGEVSISDARMVGNASVGIEVQRSSLTAPAILTVEGCELLQNRMLGISVSGAGVELVLRDSVLRESLSADDGRFGYGLQVVDGADATVERTEIAGCQRAGIIVGRDGAEATLVDVAVLDTQQDSSGDNGLALQVHSGATVAAEGCLFAGNSKMAVAVYGEGSHASLQDCSIHDTLPSLDGTGGLGISVYDGGSVAVVDSEILRSTMAGIVAMDAGTEVALRGATIRDTRQDAGDTTGRSIHVEDGAVLEAEGCVFAEATTVGISASDDGTSVVLRGCVVRDTRAGDSGQYGFGLMVLDGAALRAEGCEVRGNTGLGLAASELGSEVVLIDTDVADTVFDVSGLYGYGVELSGGASVFASGCRFTGNGAAGLVAGEVGSELALYDSVVQDTLPDVDGTHGYGLSVFDGATLLADGCELAGNTTRGLLVRAAGTGAHLLDCSVRDSQTNVAGDGGRGIEVDGGASLLAEACRITGNRMVGIVVAEPGSRAVLRSCVVTGTQPTESFPNGHGIEASQGGTLVADGCVVSGNSGVGILVADVGSSAQLRDCSVTEILPGHSWQGATGVGIAAGSGAVAEVEGLVASDIEGVGLQVTGAGSYLSCSDCSLLDNRFAGVVALAGGTLRLRGSTISGTGESVNLGGGVGVYAADQWGRGPPDVDIDDTTIADNLVAGVYLGGAGSFALDGVVITGSPGIPHGVTTRCGDGVYAAGVSAWDGSTGLLLEDCAIAEHAGTGLFLDDAHAMLSGTTWGSNEPDLLVQGEACLTPLEGYGEAPVREICPEWDQPTCALEFRLNLVAAEIDPAILAWAGPASSTPGLVLLPPRPRTQRAARSTLERYVR